MRSTVSDWYENSEHLALLIRHTAINEAFINISRLKPLGGDQLLLLNTPDKDFQNRTARQPNENG